MKNEYTKLAKSTVIVNQLNDFAMNQYLFLNNNVDRMEVPTDYKKLIKVCRFFYRVDPIASTVLNKMVDCAISDLKNQRSGCDEEEFEVYDALSEGIEEFFRNACLEYLLSGLVIPEYEWDRVRGGDLSNKLNTRKRVWIPVNLWFRDPDTITIKLSPLPNRRYYYVSVNSELINFILSGGALADGTKDVETYKELVENYPDFVASVKKSKHTTMNIKLENVRSILGKCLPEDPYPIPYMTGALESLMHKRNLRKMDYSIAARTIASIQLITLGSDLFPCTDERDFDDLKAQMNYKNVEGNNERIFQLFGNHTLKIAWVYPDTQAMLNQEKYTAVNDDIISGFGFPRTLITGETIRSNVTGGSDISTFSPIITLEAIRAKLLDWLSELYKEIEEKNDFKSGVPVPRFSALRLYKLLDIATMGKDLYGEGSMSRTTRVEQLGLDIDSELENKKIEQEKYKEYGLDEVSPVPYSSPNLGKNQNKEQTITTQEKPKEQLTKNNKGQNIEK